MTPALLKELEKCWGIVDFQNMLYFLWRSEKFQAYRSTKLVVLCWTSTAHKDNNCARHIAVITIYLLKHDTHKHSVHKHHLPDSVNTHLHLVRNVIIVCSSVAIEYVTYLANSLFTSAQIGMSEKNAAIFFSKYVDSTIMKYAAKICGNRPRLHILC